jgi:hypothetical protein
VLSIVGAAVGATLAKPIAGNPHGSLLAATGKSARVALAATRDSNVRRALFDALADAPAVLKGDNQCHATWNGSSGPLKHRDFPLGSVRAPSLCGSPTTPI